MSNQFSTVGVAGLGVAIVAINNVAEGKDPYFGLVSGGVYVFFLVLIGGFNADISTALAWVFLLGVLLTRSNAVLNLLKSF